MLGLSCEGKTFIAKTDAAGEYLFENVPPLTYGGVAVRSFNPKEYMFLKSGVMDSANFPLEADKTFFAPAMDLFKSDLKITAPKGGVVTTPGTMELKWEPYPEAAYYIYTLSTTGEYISDAPSYYSVRSDQSIVSFDKPLIPATFGSTVQAMNPNGVRLAV